MNSFPVLWREALSGPSERTEGTYDSGSERHSTNSGGMGLASNF
jgi:hypothetical protein